MAVSCVGLTKVVGNFERPNPLPKPMSQLAVLLAVKPVPLIVIVRLGLPTGAELGASETRFGACPLSAEHHVARARTPASSFNRAPDRFFSLEQRVSEQEPPNALPLRFLNINMVQTLYCILRFTT